MLKKFNFHEAGREKRGPFPPEGKVGKRGSGSARHIGGFMLGGRHMQGEGKGTNHAGTVWRVTDHVILR